MSASKFGAPAEQLRFDELASGATGDVEPADRHDRAVQAARWHDASRAIDGVRERFGAAAIGPASSVAAGADGRRRVRVVRPGAQQWGPDHDGTGTDPSAR